MPFDSSTSTPLQRYPLQFVSVEITPLVDGKYSVAMQATLLDEEELQFVGEELAHQNVASLNDVIAVIRDNITPLAISGAA